MAVPCAISGQTKTMSRRLDLLMMNKARKEERKVENRHGGRFRDGRMNRDVVITVNLINHHSWIFLNVLSSSLLTIRDRSEVQHCVEALTGKGFVSLSWFLLQRTLQVRNRTRAADTVQSITL